MSLSGFLPPLCDGGRCGSGELRDCPVKLLLRINLILHAQGNMLLDGGYLNNLPGDILRSRGAETVIAVDVGSADDTSPMNYGDSLSGWYALLVSWLPFLSKSRIPSLADIQQRLAYVSCVKQLEDVKNMPGCIYLRPPVTHFGTMEFNKFEEIYEGTCERMLFQCPVIVD